MPIYSVRGSLDGVFNAVKMALDNIDSDSVITEYRLKNNFGIDNNHRMFEIKARELDNIWDVRVVRDVYLKREFRLKFDDDIVLEIERLAKLYINDNFDEEF